MFSWLIIIILSYLFFSLASFGDKLVLRGVPNAKLYTFYVGMLNILIIFLIPFTKFGFPDPASLGWILLEATVYVLGLYAMFVALERFDVSRVMTTIGALQPILILMLTLAFWGSGVVSGMNLLAFVLLVSGSILISVEKKIKITFHYVFLISFSSLMFSLDYIFSKIVFLHQPFLQGLIWMRLACFVLVLLLLFSKKLRKQLFTKKANLDKKSGTIFVSAQFAGGIAGVLQSLAIALVPLSYLATINSLRGIQYVFLFIITLFFSLFLPKIFKEDISKKIIIQKMAAIFLIVAGLALLVF
ncbi:MAG: hypothetical protein A3D44_00180 [Candidatus Staskawiczbacteria bacterium RIFCSPHIGHO2_02_FULL_42_22]|uniref:EamA domain-containing protein n=1 Tax=Candidatus Staskawiczbacteria bacterium RIFCSPHIGHO2_02_FULL_42_22 TaxID=1802207 RepID=A0A1G2I2T1_9BACT|nr:MAG: hypothetical protein A3D44_00180 [Candidatus Staskawiczbacteria bacterium RIFCSPHIGHO2_02_FULL_42_22]